MSLLERYWAVLLLAALLVCLLTILLETSWPVARVEVVTIPSGALLTAGNGWRWTSPALVPVPDEGIRLTATHPDRMPVDTLLTTEEGGGRLTIILPYTFPVTVTSRPPGATVLLDGEYRGVTPVSLELGAPGTYPLKLTSQGVVTLRDSVTLASNAPESLHYVLPELREEGMLLVRRESVEGSELPPGQEALLPDSFLIGRYEVTALEYLGYLAAMEPDPGQEEDPYRWNRTETFESIFPGDYPLPYYQGNGGGWQVMEGLQHHPVPGVCYDAAMDYCRWLTETREDGLTYRLPTEAEWRAAAQAGGDGPWPWGATAPFSGLLNLSDSNEMILRRHPSIDDGFSETAPVGSYPPNGWGLYDMAGNLWEWCAPAPGDSQPVAMGGSWLSSAEDCRCDSRMVPEPGLGFPFVGFRLAADPD